MACRNDGKRKCFTFIWKLENASFCGQFDEECVDSPAFEIDEIHKTKWNLELHASYRSDDDIGFILQRQVENENDADVEIDCEFAFLSTDGIVLRSTEEINKVIEKDSFIGNWEFASRNEVFFERRAEFLSQDTLTARCRIWKSVGEISEDVQCFARTRIIVEKRSFMWNIKDFSTLQTGEKLEYEIKSINADKQLMALKLFVTFGFIFDETIRLQIVPNFQNIKTATLQVCIVDVSKNAKRCFQREFCALRSVDENECASIYSSRELMEHKSVYLPNDILSLWCECAWSSGETVEEIVSSDYITIEKKRLDDSIAEKRNELPISKANLISDFKSLLNDNIVSDLKLKTRNKTYPVHKCILSARSPVFKAMFSNDMKEKVSDCLDIEDLNDDAVQGILRYIYSAEVEDLEWDSAAELYEAADKYQILDLKDICSSYLKDHVCLRNVCEALLLADLHQDNTLKEYLQHFILKLGKDIIYSDEWEDLMKFNVKLAAETMRLKFKD